MRWEGKKVSRLQQGSARSMIGKLAPRLVFLAFGALAAGQAFSLNRYAHQIRRTDRGSQYLYAHGDTHGSATTGNRHGAVVGGGSLKQVVIG